MIRNGKPHGTHLEVFNKITQLCHKLGYCYADNRYLAKELDLSISRISHIISDLYNAGLVERDITYKKGLKQVEQRYLRVVTARVARGMVENNQEQNVSDNIKIKPTSPIRTQAVQMGVKLGINMMVVLGMIKKYGAEYVIEKLHIVANSLSVKSNVALFVKACTANYTAGKKVKAAIDSKQFDVPYRKSTQIAHVSMPERSEIKESTLENNSFLKEFMTKNPTAGLSKKFSAQLSL